MAEGRWYNYYKVRTEKVWLKEDGIITARCRQPRWPSGKTSASRAEDPEFESRLRRDFFWGRVIPVT